MELKNGSTAGYAALEIAHKFPNITCRPEKLILAVNDEYRNHSHVLIDGDELALIPPVSGGSDD